MRSNGNEAEQPTRAPDASPALSDNAGGKASFDDIYDQTDPRAYYRTLRPHEYQIPHHAQRLIRRLLGTKHLVNAAENGPLSVLDVCCSYGLNAALLNHTLSLEDLYRHYAEHDPREGSGHRPSASELAVLDREFYAEHRRYDAVRTLGLDAARGAVSYAGGAGLLDEGFAEDLERDDPSPALRRALEEVSLITISGGVGYVTERTFDRLTRELDRPVWVMALVLRTVGYQEIARVLSRRGLTTVRAEKTYPQRRFTSPDERRHALRAIRDAGLSPEGREAEGYYHADLYVSGPADQGTVTSVLAEIVDGEEPVDRF